eukprot:TRINITY_DN6364_c0_g1_i1.p1 TRINITY_DN6364_c0_g1~~TRINITY_DN6364_c0_g1_i1.p1  ORF type:complete len:692 (+),score=87.96 TRINITY_DN6364_c0_g1_i1:81-2156(+)
MTVFQWKRSCILVVAIALAELAAAEATLSPRLYDWLPMTDIKPRGWLKKQAEIQASSLGGHLQVFWLPDNKWLGGSKCPSVLCESVPYWLNGLIPLAVQVDDSVLLNVTHTYIKTILDLQTPDGWMGPGNATSGEPESSPWPRYRMLTALAQYADIPGADSRTVSAMRKLVVALGAKLKSFSLHDMKYKFPWAHARWQELVLNAQWLVDRDPDHMANHLLFDVMKTAMDKGLNWQGWYDSRKCSNSSDDNCFPCREFSTPKTCEFASRAYFCQHGVNIPQSFTAFSVTYRLTGNTSEGFAAKRATEKLDYCHGQPGGVWSAHEVLGGIEPNCGTETCSVVETMQTMAELFSYFGHMEHLDRIEKAAFNRLPASYFNGSMWALTYFHQSNDNGGCNTYGLPFECCVANGNQGWPKFTSHLYARRGGDNIFAIMYAPSDLHTTLEPEGRANQVHILLETRYPFSESLNFSIDAEGPFKFWLRIPAWAVDATVKVDGGASVAASPGGFHGVDVPGGRHTTVELTLPLEVTLTHEAAGGVSVQAGPLLFAMDLDPTEKKSKDCYFPPEGCNPTIDPTVDWRTALVLDSGDRRAGGLKIEWPAEDVSSSTLPPFQRLSPLPRIHGLGTVLTEKSWPTVKCTAFEDACQKCVGPVPNVTTPAFTSMVTLVPFGATDVRTAVLPFVWSDEIGYSALTI